MDFDQALFKGLLIFKKCLVNQALRPGSSRCRRQSMRFDQAFSKVTSWACLFWWCQSLCSVENRHFHQAALVVSNEEPGGKKPGGTLESASFPPSVWAFQQTYGRQPGRVVSPRSTGFFERRARRKKADLSEYRIERCFDQLHRVVSPRSTGFFE